VFTHDAASQIDSAGYAYDAMGRLTADLAQTYTWDLASRLLTVDDGSVVSFSYDALGMRVARTDVSGTRTYIWNYGLGLSSVNVEQEGGSDLRYFVYTPGGALLYRLEAVGEARLDYHFDEMGNTQFLTDGSGSVVASYAYGPHGEVLGEAGAVENPFQWQGQWGLAREPTHELDSARLRWYSPSARRFLSRDLIGASGARDASPYQYAMGDPLRFADPTGLDEAEVKLGGIARSPLDVAPGPGAGGCAPGESASGPVSRRAAVREKSAVVCPGPACPTGSGSGFASSSGLTVDETPVEYRDSIESDLRPRIGGFPADTGGPVRRGDWRDPGRRILPTPPPPGGAVESPPSGRGAESESPLVRLLGRENARKFAGAVIVGALQPSVGTNAFTGIPGGAFGMGPGYPDASGGCLSKKYGVQMMVSPTNVPQ
jgi:RHS repeat-associated protein